MTTRPPTWPPAPPRPSSTTSSPSDRVTPVTPVTPAAAVGSGRLRAALLRRPPHGRARPRRTGRASVGCPGAHPHRAVILISLYHSWRWPPASPATLERPGARGLATPTASCGRPRRQPALPRVRGARRPTRRERVSACDATWRAPGGARDAAARPARVVSLLTSALQGPRGPIKAVVSELELRPRGAPHARPGAPPAPGRAQGRRARRRVCWAPPARRQVCLGQLAAGRPGARAT